MSLLSAAEFKQAYFEAEVRDIMTMVGDHMTECIEELIDARHSVSLDITKISKEAVSVATDRLTFLGYEYKMVTTYDEVWLHVVTPNTKDLSGVDTTVDFSSEKGVKKRKTQA